MAATTPTTTGVRVEIYDQTYQLRGTDPEHIQKLAALVDEKIRKIAQQTQTVDSQRLAVLAALNIADEFLTLKKKYESLTQETHKRTTHLDAALDEILAETRRIG